MADILIRGMEMPKDDRITIQIGADGAVYFVEKCTIMAEKYEKSSHAAQLPEGHGDLIDRDALRKEIDANRPGRSYEDGWALTVMDHAPTIVPAEGGTDKCSEN